MSSSARNRAVTLSRPDTHSMQWPCRKHLLKTTLSGKHSVQLRGWSNGSCCKDPLCIEVTAKTGSMQADHTVLLRSRIFCCYILGALTGHILFFQTTKMKYLVKLVLIFLLFLTLLCRQKRKCSSRFFLILFPCRWPTPHFENHHSDADFSQAFNLFKLWKLTVFSVFCWQ